ncbi:uncharacterized protein LOC121859572 [Homarus americanus]|uniref:uncharacterized protein LOC121859572 n=1 Tax=Homarus americanus TaxID=6706 RepID=UPI001C46A226|nr:uncharacterized protein LOC121859572 [Homarus americanus]
MKNVETRNYQMMRVWIRSGSYKPTLIHRLKASSTPVTTIVPLRYVPRKYLSVVCSKNYLVNCDIGLQDHGYSIVELRSLVRGNDDLSLVLIVGFREDEDTKIKRSLWIQLPKLGRPLEFVWKLNITQVTFSHSLAAPEPAAAQVTTAIPGTVTKTFLQGSNPPCLYSERWTPPPSQAGPFTASENTASQGQMVKGQFIVKPNDIEMSKLPNVDREPYDRDSINSMYNQVFFHSGNV